MTRERATDRHEPSWIGRRAGLAARVLAAAGVLHFLVVPQIGGTRKALGLVGGMNPALVLGALALEAGSLAAYAQLSRALLPSAMRLPL